LILPGSAASVVACGAAKGRLDLVYFLDAPHSMETVNIYDAKTRLSQLVDKAASGEDVVVSRNGKALVRITVLSQPKRQIKFGVLKGKVRIAADFDAPLPDEILAAFEGR
jgi:prevent-host-death family protein